jgi:hypothetical protein
MSLITISLIQLMAILSYCCSIDFMMAIVMVVEEGIATITNIIIAVFNLYL